MLFEGEGFASIPAKIWGANVPPPAAQVRFQRLYDILKGEREMPRNELLK